LLATAESVSRLNTRTLHGLRAFCQPSTKPPATLKTSPSRAGRDTWSMHETRP